MVYGQGRIALKGCTVYIVHTMCTTHLSMYLHGLDQTVTHSNAPSNAPYPLKRLVRKPVAALLVNRIVSKKKV